MTADWSPLWLSIRVAAAAAAIVLVAGLPTALWLARTRSRARGLVAGALMLPIVLPPTVVGYALLLLLGRRSPAGAWLDDALGVRVVFHWSGAAIASACSAFPLFLLPARSAFEEVDPALEDAARLLGRGEASVFLDVTLPIAARGIVAGLVLAFARALGDFGASMMVAGSIPGRTQTAAMAIYEAAMAGEARRAAALSAGVSAASIAALILVQRLAPGRRAARR